MTSDALPSDDKDRRLLRYFGQSLLALGPAGRDWPGFRYTPPEWERFSVHAATVSANASWIAMFSAAAIFIVMAAAAIGFIFIPAMLWLYPDPAKTSALVFLTGLFGTAFLTIGIGYPIALNAGGLIADRWETGELAAVIDLDRALATKIRRQIWRMMGILCGIGIPGSLILLIYDIDLDPVLRWMKPVTYAATILVMLFTARQARKPIA
ncbi:hypothetical protein SAMN05444161_4931 [Rhizobiales bacterium GAS191]|nr:hypothetical protein SAMN05519103_04203 [Rhizobiales bacterium GAS113]SEE13146.1 hypothetical protein SAMN05444161_4931 [Rhizobiales bacterium GAS191]